MGWMGDATAALDQLAEQARKTREEAFGGFREDIHGMTDEIYGLGDAFEQTANEVGDIVEDRLPKLLNGFVFQVEERTQEAATKLDDFMFQLQDIADSGNDWAQRLLGIIHQVREGIVDASDVMNAFGNGVVQFNGEMRNVRDVLQDVLPSLGEVRREIGQTMAELEKNGFTLEELIGRLRQQHLTYAHDFARLLEAFKEGRATIEAVLRAARKLQQAFPDSEAAALANELQILLLQDDT